MQSRMDKYYKNSNTDTNTKKELRFVKAGRTQKNQELYKEVSHLELEDFDLNSNASVIGDNTNVNINDIKDMLDKKYPESNKKHSIGDSTEEINLPKINLDETREYDINSILEKAKEKKEVSYEQDRLKKVHNTQYDILKSLDILKENDEDEEDSEELEVVKSEDVVTRKKQEKLLDLIDTITAKELVTDDDGTSDLDPLDILSDLRGDDENTKVMGALEVENEIEDTSDEEDTRERTLELDVEEPTKAISEDEITNEDEEVVDNKSNVEEDDEFLKELEQQEVKVKKVKNRKNYVEFDDFSDLKDDMLVTKILVRILVFIIIVVFIIACVLLANKYLGLGLF